MRANLVNKKIIRSINSSFPTWPKKLLLAVSGGPDSQCLLQALPHVMPDCEFIAVGVHHGFRDEADAELDLAQELAESKGIKFIRKRLTITVNPGESLQAVARDARYGCLFEIADNFKIEHVVTGHHADDKAETFLIRLVRGRGLGSLGVMPSVSGRIFRPMLDITREEVLAYLHSWNVKYAKDPSNENEDFLRVWVRKELIPMLASKNPKIVSRINETIDKILEI